MGGVGSGGWNRSGRAAAEDCLRLDAAFLQRRGFLAPGRSILLTWTSTRLGETTRSDIRAEIAADAITLVYRWRCGVADWRDVREKVALDPRPRSFGGAQAFFLCPGCGARRRVLRLAHGVFRCRLCHRLVHASTREREADRAMRRASALRKRLGAEPGLDALFPRPRGMHRRTHDRIAAEILAKDREVWDEAARLLTRLDRRVRSPARSSGGAEFWG